MPISILLAFASLGGYAFGDFFTQKSVQKIGTVKNLFFFGAIGALFLTPFILASGAYKALTDTRTLGFFALLVVVIIAANVSDFEALKKSRFAIIQPVYSIELPLVIVLSIAVLGERIGYAQWISIALIFSGLLLAASAKPFFRNLFRIQNFETGTFWALASASALALSSLLLALSSRETSPLLVAWVAQMALCLSGGCYLLFAGGLKDLANDFRKNKAVLFLQGGLQDVAIASFAFAALYGNLSTVSVIVQNYVVLSVVLGVFLNKDRLEKHQKIGVGLSIIGLLVLSVLDKGSH